jgi:glyoxylase-like metal-dependent hydrolase (beta-lactamase superfamily II)
MQKSGKRTIFGIICFIGVLVIFGIYYGVNFYSETSKMKPLATTQIAHNVFAIKDNFVNVYLIKNNDRYIAIDAGISTNTLRTELTKLNINPESIEAVFLTHAHHDHIGGLAAFSNVKYFISKMEKSLSSGKFSTLDDGSITTIAGIDIQCIYTPGHTVGSVSYKVCDSLLFVGDNLSIDKNKAGVFNEFFNKDTKVQIESIKKLREVKNIAYVFSAHYGYSNTLGDFYINFK